MLSSPPTVSFLPFTRAAKMGDQETLTDFLSWGNKKYKSARSSLVLWNHGGGLDYKAFIQALADEPLDSAGKAICHSFMEKSKTNGKSEKSTISFFDLSKADELITEFDDFAASLNSVLEQGGKEKISSTAAVSEKFGDDSTNLIDLGDFVSRADFYDGTRIAELLGQFVVCTESSGKNNKGVSFWFPADSDGKDIESYGYISISDKYLQFLKLYVQG